MRDLRMLTRRALSAAAIVVLLASSASGASIELVGAGTVPGTTTDGLLLEPVTLEDGTPHDRMGGFGSGLAYTGIGTRYIAVPDRGPADGTTSYRDRYYLLDIVVTPGAVPPVTVSLVKATPLTTESGASFAGSSAAFDATNSPASLRLDPEGIRVGPTGTFFVSDEYGPFVYEFDAAGRRLRALPVPAKFLIEHPNANGADELPSPPAAAPGNSTGRQANRGMEGLAIAPDGTKLYGIMQSPLIQDGALNSSNQRRGVHNRLLEIDLATGATREFVYVLDSRSNGTNEILAVNDHQFLVVERDGNAGGDAAFKRIVAVDITGATDVSGVASLPQTAPLPADITPVSKTPFIDLLASDFGLAGSGFPEKIEGLAFGPDLADGRHLLLVASDNDFLPTQDTRVFAFAIESGALPGFAPQVLTPAVQVRTGPNSNRINLKSRGTVPVVIPSGGLLDATAIDPATIVFAGAAVKTRRTPPGPDCRVREANGDGLPDLVCQFETQDLDLEPGDTTVPLTATTFSGTPVEATALIEASR